ncbi:hypothetical protein [Modestobacter sp. Leaf380]|uniref:hypothetical protein n=1 Tax=Modestobacter sp. Leaf380 TaxID=1736356 RepID=UPI0012F8BE6C|nr:hypothetical protein [Modestobacter sp. Leaf380]
MPTEAPVAPSSPGIDEESRGGAVISARTQKTRTPRSRRAVAVVLVAAVVGAVLGGLGSLLAGPSYSTESHVLWNPAGVQYADETVNADPNLVERQVTDQVDVIMSDAVMGTAADTLGTDVEDLREEISVGVATGSSLMVVTGSGDSATAAADATTAVTDAYVGYLRDNGRAVLNQRADVLQGTIERQTAQLAELDGQLTALNDQLGGLNPTTAAYGAVQGRIDRLATQISDLTTRSADLVDEQETLRANAAIFPGEAFVLQQAEVPEGPSSLSPAKAALVGAALGVVVGACVVAFTTSRSRSGGRGHRTARTAP